MNSKFENSLRKVLTLSILAQCAVAGIAQIAVQPHTMRKIGEVDPRFLSYNIEAVEVTGGRFWKPYAPKKTDSGSSPQNQPAGMDANLYQYRSPINLTNPKLRTLAAALAPAYLRVSGTWRNTTVFQDSDQAAPSAPPEGYRGVMTRAQWKGVIDFSRVVGADLVTSVATSAGTRDANGIWTPVEARPFFEFTKRVGGKIAATEFMNEPTFANLGGVPKGYDAAAFAKDTDAFRVFLREASPDTKFLGPGSTGEGAPFVEGLPVSTTLKTENMLQATGPIFDIFSYHFYGSVSKRCVGPKMALTPEKSLAPKFFDKNITVEEFYAKLRDTYDPGKPMWLTETGEAGCGGDPWASSFTDSFRFLDQLGSLAQRSVKTVMVNTLASSDYGLLDEDTLDPRPNFWSALLWKRLMGAKSLDPGVPPSDGLRIYAHCTQGLPGAVTLLAINFGKDERAINLESPVQRYTLSSDDPSGSLVNLNGVLLSARADGKVPKLVGLPSKAGVQQLGAMTITFLKISNANNSACK